MFGFTRVCVGALRLAYGWSDTLGVAWVHSREPRGYLVHSGSRGFTQRQLGVVGYIRGRVGSLKDA